VVLSVGVALSPELWQNLWGIRNPFGLELPLWVEAAFYDFLPLLPLCLLASVGSLVSGYRRAAGEERQQIKWISFAASVVGVVCMIAMGQLVRLPVGGLVSRGLTPCDWISWLTRRWVAPRQSRSPWASRS
jgi:hypothetical protein